MVSAPTAQGVEKVTDPTSNVQMLDRNTGSEAAIFGGLPSLSEICNEPTIEEASNILAIGGSSRSTHIQDQTQGIISAYDVPSENVPIPSANLDEIRTQAVVDPPCPEKEICFPEVPVSNPTGVQDRVCPEWMNTPASSSHPSPGSHPDRPNTPVSRMSLNEISLRARFIQDEKLNEIIRIGIHQRRLWIGQLQREIRTLSQNQVDPKILEEMKNKMEIAVAEAQQYKDQNIILESNLQKMKDELQSTTLNLSDSQRELGSAQQELAYLN
ncbi:hypothetical protein Nepgr_004190 [Nepenthes gracilis]|uniref:Uncharacterized protein n=1 Tax=Nepenthes gracilis TaxID=150966 RepID=A0AAD3S102_NEPGR|nr:hypothetical protein Nepgr_004190 [Nepenthes gracilis]